MAVMIRQMIATRTDNYVFYKPVYLGDTEGIALVFEDEEEARAWLYDCGVTEEMIEKDGIVFERIGEEEC